MSSPSTPVAGAQPTAQPGGQPVRGRAAGIIIVLLIVLCLVFVGGYVQRLGEKAAVEAEIARMEQRIAEAKVRSAVLAKELAQVNDEAHIAAIARDALNLVQEGDQLIAVVEAPMSEAAAGSAEGAARTPVSADPNWRRWLDLLFPMD